MVCHLPHQYPAVPPEIFVRAHSLSKAEHKRLSEDLTNFIMKQERNEIIMAAIIQWLQDNVESYQTVETTPEHQKKKVASTAQIKDSKFSRM